MKHAIELEEFDCERSSDVEMLVRHLADFHELEMTEILDRMVLEVTIGEG